MLFSIVICFLPLLSFSHRGNDIALDGESRSLAGAVELLPGVAGGHEGGLGHGLGVAVLLHAILARSLQYRMRKKRHA